MAKKGSIKVARLSSSKKGFNKPAAGWKQVLLSLSLVPLVAGVVLIILWAIDLYLWQSPDSQIIVAVLFFFLSFSISNLVQGNWLAALGWFLLMIADGLLLSQGGDVIKIVAIVIGVIALIILAVEITLRLRSQNKTR